MVHFPGGRHQGEALCLPNSEIMIHQPSGGTQGQAIDIEIQTKRLLRIKGISIEFWQTLPGNLGADREGYR